MKLRELYEAQKNGALKVKYDEISGVYTMCGSPVNPVDLKKFLQVLGWTRLDQPIDAIYDKTNKYVTNFKKHIKHPDIVNAAEVEFQNFRRSNTLTYYDRIVIRHPRKIITILIHMPGLGGTYAVFNSGNPSQPDFACRTLTDLCDYINELFGVDTSEN